MGGHYCHSWSAGNGVQCPVVARFEIYNIMRFWFAVCWSHKLFLSLDIIVTIYNCNQVSMSPNITVTKYHCYQISLSPSIISAIQVYSKRCAKFFKNILMTTTTKIVNILPYYCKYNAIKTIKGHFRKIQRVKFATNYLKFTTRQYWIRFYCYFHWKTLFLHIFWYNPKFFCFSLVLSFALFSNVET